MFVTVAGRWTARLLAEFPSVNQHACMHARVHACMRARAHTHARTHAHKQVMSRAQINTLLDKTMDLNRSRIILEERKCQLASPQACSPGAKTKAVGTQGEEGSEQSVGMLAKKSLSVSAAALLPEASLLPVMQRSRSVCRVCAVHSPPPPFVCVCVCARARVYTYNTCMHAHIHARYRVRWRHDTRSMPRQPRRAKTRPSPT